MTLNGHGNGGPWWAKLALQAGGATAIALVALYYLGERIPDRLDQHETAAAAREAVMTDRLQLVTMLLRQICANAAETAAERSTCFGNGGGE